MRGPPSRADAGLVAYAAERSVAITPTQLERWRSGAHPLLPRNRRVGRSSEPAEGVPDYVVWLGRESTPGRRPYELALLAFDEGHPVPEPTVRWAFRRPVERLRLPGEDRAPVPGADSEDWAADVAGDLLASGADFTVLPRRVQAIDKRLTAAGLDWSPPPIADLDDGPREEELSRRDFATTAVSGVLLGPDVVPGADSGGFVRMLLPHAAASPFASMVERAGESAEADERIVDEVGAMVFMPSGDMRVTLAKLVDEASAFELRSAWRAAGDLRNWACALCAATEGELDERELGPAAQEWVAAAALALPRVFLVNALRDRRWTPSDRAFDSAMLLWLRDMIRRLREMMPDGQFELLRLVLPECLHDFVDLGVDQRAPDS